MFLGAIEPPTRSQIITFFWICSLRRLAPTGQDKTANGFSLTILLVVTGESKRKKLTQAAAALQVKEFTIETLFPQRLQSNESQNCVKFAPQSWGSDIIL